MMKDIFPHKLPAVIDAIIALDTELSVENGKAVYIPIRRVPSIDSRAVESAAEIFFCYLRFGGADVVTQNTVIVDRRLMSHHQSAWSSAAFILVSVVAVASLSSTKRGGAR